MDYVVGSVAALITGNVTPNRPRLMKRALTPTKHQPSPNVTPKSEFVEDRSIFLSPSMQKKKAIVKKSPKRIFQNPDLETTDNGDGNLSATSPKADKVKKHLKEDLESDNFVSKNNKESKSPKNKGKNKRESITADTSNSELSGQVLNENTPKKKKKKNNSTSETVEEQSSRQEDNVTDSSVNKSPNKMKQRRKSVINDESNKENDNIKMETDTVSDVTVKSPKKNKNKSLNKNTQEPNIETTGNTNNTKSKKKKNKKKKKKLQEGNVKAESTEIKADIESNDTENKVETPKKKNKKRKKSKSQSNLESMDTDQAEEKENNEEIPVKKSKIVKINPNAVTDKESDSEHESDNEIESENEEINKNILKADAASDESSEEDEEAKVEEAQKEKGEKTGEGKQEKSEAEIGDEIKRTLFVGNVPFSPKCKKEIKKIFNKHGLIETIRIRTVPVKDGRYTPKLAVIKNELHPERTTVNVYIKFKEIESVEKALSENNTLLNDHHLRVSRSSNSGAEHDPKCSIFVGNLPFALEDEALREKFENCGEIESVRIIRDKKTNAGKGFGYVNFASKDGVELALALTDEDLTIKNRIIRVKRCTQLTNKQKQGSNDSKGQKQFNQRVQGQRENQGGQRGPQGLQKGGNQGFQRGGNQGFQRGGNQGFQKGGNQGFQRGGNQRFERGGNQSFQRGGFQKGNQGNFRQGNADEEGRFGAHRRVMNKRKNQDGTFDGPPNKKQNINQPSIEKKSRKEFVGMTAEKKKKRKFDKGQKKKKALSEILTK